MSLASDGTEGNHASESPSISSDGRYVTFVSMANNLVSDDTNFVADVFVHDRQTGETTRVSVASDGAQGNGVSTDPAISGDGRYVMFRSGAGNLVSGDTNGAFDIFVHDRDTGETTRVSVASSGAQADANSWESTISGDGRYVAFRSYASNLVSNDTNGDPDVFIHDRDTGETTRVSVAWDGSEANDHSSNAAVSWNGRYVAFDSNATNLVGDDTNGRTDVFVRDRDG